MYCYNLFLFCLKLQLLAYVQLTILCRYITQQITYQYYNLQ